MIDIKYLQFLLFSIEGETCIRGADKKSNKRFKERAVGSSEMGGVFGLPGSGIFNDMSILLDQRKL